MAYSETPRVLFEPDVYGEDTVLLCPNCRGSNLHHVETVDFDRTEDAATVTRTAIRGGFVSSHLVEDSRENPSSRRHGIVLRFTCEMCPAGDDAVQPMELRIAQHKGFTLLRWRWPTTA